jgi:tetratricopeptide (TPR) repeat protein
MEGIPAGKSLELGDRHLERGELDLALRFYTLALKQDPAEPYANRRIVEIYREKAGAGDALYYKLALPPLRRALKADPLNEELHALLRFLSMKAGSLDALTREYGQKSRSGPEKAFYELQLRRTAALALLGSEPKRQAFVYSPAPYIKYFFDFVVLPVSVIGVAAGHIVPKLKPFFGLGLVLFMFYCAYRAILYLLLRPK